MNFEFNEFVKDKIFQYIPASFVKVGNKYNGRCPICGDSKKSSRKRRGWIYLDSGCSYYCFNCGTSLSGLQLLKYFSGEDYSEIKKEFLKLFARSHKDMSLSAHYEIPSEEPSLFQLTPMVKPEWKLPLTDNAKKYLKDRFVLDAPFFDGKLYSWKNKKNDEYILIPWKLNGVDAYFQLNDFQKLGSMKYIFPKDSKKLVAGLDNVDVSWPYIICFEGYYDSVFVKNGVCVGTKSITQYQLKLIKERFPKHQIVISFDNDKAGLASMSKIIQKQNDFKFFKWFNEHTEEKDINDFIKAHGNTAAFSQKETLKTMIVDKLVMKMWLMKTGKWVSDKV